MIKKIQWWAEPHRAGVTIVANATVEIAGKTERFMIFREVGRYELITARALSWVVGRNIERMTRELRHHIAFEGHTL